MIKSLQSLRAIGALMIFTHNFANQTLTTSYVSEACGSCPVNWFFMLSGFVLCLAFEGRQMPQPMVTEARRFTASRFRRLAPLYYAGLIFGVLVAFFIGKQVGIPQVSASALMIQSWIPNSDYFYGVNSPLWFTCDIMFCYTLFIPLYRLLTRHKGIFSALLCVIIACYAGLIMFTPRHIDFILAEYTFYVMPLIQLPAFMAGMFLWSCYRQIRGIKLSASAANVIIVSAIALICIAIRCNEYLPGRLTFSIFWWIPNALLIAALTLTDGIDCTMTHILHWQPLIALGNSSMALYLLHRPWITLIHYLVARFDIAVPISVLWAVSISVMIVVSIIVHRSFYRNRI